MKKLHFEVPAMYADHHVLEIRKLLFEIPGVEDVYASSAFRVVEVTAADSISEEEVEEALNQAGYLGELELPVEFGTAGLEEDGQKPFFRHTASYVETKQVISFQQSVPYTGRPLWPCPGMGPLPSNGEKEE